MKVWTVGGDDPEVAVVACQHGNEACGAVAVERLREELDEGTVGRPVALIVANEEAKARGVRGIDADLNRVFPGEAGSEDHERRLAHELAALLADCEAVLDLHSTESDSPPFAIVQSPDRRTLDLARATGLPVGVDMSAQAGTMLSYVDGVAVECGIRGTEAAATVATDVTRTFLRATGVLPGDSERVPDEPGRAPMTWYRVLGEVPKDDRDWTFTGRNFERVAAEEAYARSGDATMRAAEAFYPVLMSDEGYDSILGFRARRVDEAALRSTPPDGDLAERRSRGP